MNRFDMEEMIMSCWDTKEDIKLISESIVEGDLSKDSIVNALVGMAELHDIKCKKLFDIFEEMISAGQISIPDDQD